MASIPDAVQREADRIGTGRPGELAAHFYVCSLATLTASDDDLERLVRQSWASLYEAENGDSNFPDCEVYLIRVDHALHRRYALVRVLLRAHDDPSLFTRRPAESEIGQAFASAQNLFSDTLLGLSAYLDPLYLSASPWVWCFESHRRGGVILYSLGMPIPGRLGEPAEPLQLHLPRGGSQSYPRPAGVDPFGIAAALAWWIQRLDRLFSRITDPANFCDRDGQYLPRRHFEVLLGVEQLFRHVGSLLANERDTDARRTLFFGAMDTYEGLGGGGFHELVSYEKAVGVLDDVEQAVGKVAGALLLPNARRGVEGLRQVQDGFFLPSRVSSAGIRVPRRGGDVVIGRAEASALWLRVLRNSTHGFRGRANRHQDRDEALLVSHNGAVTEDLFLLGYLYLMQLLADPDVIDKILRSAVG